MNPSPTSQQLSEFKEAAAPIEETVAALDLPEENISTLLCYLENNNDEKGRQWLKLHNPVYSLCKIRDGRWAAESSYDTYKHWVPDTNQNDIIPSKTKFEFL